MRGGVDGGEGIETFGTEPFDLVDIFQRSVEVFRLICQLREKQKALTHPNRINPSLSQSV